MSIDEPPLRAQLFTAEEMEQHGQRLAAGHQLTHGRGRDRLLRRLGDNEAVLGDACALLAQSAELQRRVTPAGEWLLDNFYLIEEEVRAAKRHLPPGFSRELPRIANGDNAGLPRVYDLAMHAVAHGDSRLGRGSLTRFIASYQTVKTLRMGELWAVPIMLRLALIENLRRIAARVAASVTERDLAGLWADRMIDVAERDPKSLILVVADMARSEPPMTAPFVAELSRRLHGRTTALALPLTWVEQHLGESHQTIEHLVKFEAQAQAAAQVSVSNSIGSLRLLSSMDWRDFVETLSKVEQVLRNDPADVYARMEFATRDSYRHEVERIARHCEGGEAEVASAAVQLARKAAQGLKPAPHRSHVGYWLVDEGQVELERAVAMRAPFAHRVRRVVVRRPLAWFAGAILTTTLLLALAPLVIAMGGLAGLLVAPSLGAWVVVAGIVATTLISASQLAVAFVNWLAPLVARPRVLPRMDFSFGIPSVFRTLVVVPTMLSSTEGIDALAEALEVRFLANRDAHLHFALLTDFLDASAQVLPGDEALMVHARECIEGLNRRYSQAGEDSRVGDRFFLFHRPRCWNAADGVWMGRERKRGKLEDLNALLRGAGDPHFCLVVGDPSALSSVRYVITLDTDTQLPRDVARKFVATMAHPLNRPRFGGRPHAPRVVGGYGILQPRVGFSVATASRTRYVQLFGGDAGIDPYTRAVSDVYQDLFGEGSFIGKGIYDVDAFEHVLGRRLPEGRVLSHDLLEGGYARSGLISDVELVEESPARHDADIKRRHRWMRGDWQIAAWVLPRVPTVLRGTGGWWRCSALGPNPLSALSRLKILDNLRRSIVPVALMLLLLLGWAVLAQPVFWTLAVAAVILVPAWLGPSADLVRKPDQLAWRAHLLGVAAAAWRQLIQALVAMATLPYEAWLSLDAVLRTLWRLHVSHRGLLEWQTSAEASRRPTATALGDFTATYQRMAVAPATALIAFAGLAFGRPEALVPALPVLLLWVGAPAFVWRLNQPLPRRQSTINEAQALQLRLLARRTWAFFETFVGADDHHLPPDNVQEHPVERVAHRTSPTNIGLSLLATLTAHDFGFVTTTDLIERTGATLDTMARMERHHGHWLNWYDTRTLQPLRPAYISTVDSGNLAGHLLTLRAGLKGLADARAQGDLQSRSHVLLGGLADTLGLLQQALRSGDDTTAPVERFAVLLAQTRVALRSTPDELFTAWQALSGCADELLATLPRAPPVAGVDLEVSYAQPEAERWTQALKRQCEAAAAEVSALSSPPMVSSDAHWDEAALAAQSQQLRQLAERIDALVEMDFAFLYDTTRDLLAIGYNVDDRRLDAGHYDLLASEVRLACFVAIAGGQIPQASWFALGRQLATLEGKTVLLSWSGSMFEYLMPMLVMPSYEHTLLDETMRGAVERQVRYGRQRGVPWGISESGYNTTDAQLNYQYRAFGVPGLGLKRGMAADLVVAPYATVMALMVDPRAAVANLQRLAVEGAAGTFGYHEAIDYTPSRLPRGEKSAVVRSYMAHHQGMGLLALAYLLLDRPMQRRFESDPALQATLLLLQERVPRAVPFHPEMAERVDFRSGQPITETPLRVITTANTASPEVQLLSNGRYHVMLTASGAGYSRWRDFAVTRWREDGTTDAWGSFCYLRDTETGTFWSTTPQPTQGKPDRFEAVFSEGRAEFRRRDHGIDAYTEVVVSPEDDIELRRLRLTNRGRVRRTIELTTYTEIVIAPAASDAAHPAFSKLFVQTEILEQPPLVLATRRPRSAEEQSPWMFHLVAVHGASSGPVSHETDRARFIGRGRGLHAPQALLNEATGSMRDAAPLSGTSGSVLDPVVATRRVITLEPEQTALVDIVYGAADSRDACLALANKVMDRRLADRVFELAWTHSQVILRQLNASEADAQTYARLANTVVYSQPTLRADAQMLLRNRRGQSGLWGYAISGDLPIVLLQISDAGSIDLVHQMVQAHAWWRLKGLTVDLVIWNEERDIYRQRLHEQILGLLSSSIESHVVDSPGGIFVRHAEHIADEDRVLLQAVARAIISDRLGTLAQQVDAKRIVERRPAPLAITRAHEPAPATLRDTSALRLFNGCGGFSADGREYVIDTDGEHRPPAPWVNVIANPRFGTVISEAGSAYTWCENAHELRLTPWHNDPVCDTGGEAIFLRDEESGHVWSPTSSNPDARRDLQGVQASSPHRVRHGFGYSVFEHDEAEVRSELSIFVSLDDAVKYSRLVLRNDGPRRRRLSATGYVEWVLGDLREKNAPHVHTEIATDNGAIYARNRYSHDFGDWIAFFDVDPDDRASGSVTADREEFIGRNGSLRRPAALRREGLSGRTGAALDPCAAIQVVIDLAPGQSREIVFRLGMGRSADEAAELVQRHRGSAAARATLAAVQAHWHHALGAVQVKTPDAALDLLTNGWLMYQTIACRMWARSGYYQSGGAYGFRDQLQDAMALVHTRPRLLREHLLLCAGRQFPEGDVQHWWHPPAGRGVRTHISDDYLWLPLALVRYVQSTNDTGVLDEPVGFIDGPPVAPHEESWYDMPRRATDIASLYEHARRSVKHGLRYGAHGLPLIGAGDWNDGMNRVGSQGQGESVWLGFFLCEVLREFAPLARRRGDEAFAMTCDAEHAGLAQRLEAVGWDGGWYRRAYFDDGTPLGSSESSECRIDAIAQSWAVLSGVGSHERVRRAMDAVSTHLVREDAGLVQLLDPPFDRRGPNPGYIAGYVPGVRENGGQYTHSAVWSAMAFAALGDAERAWAVMGLINPLNHGRSADEVEVYKVEPYVVAADVYSVWPHAGRGGWSWYTGSAGWMYRLVVESLLGLTLQVDDNGARLLIRPCLPAGWSACHVDYRFHETTYSIDIVRADGAPPSIRLDGELLPGDGLALVDDGRLHVVRLVL